MFLEIVMTYHEQAVTFVIPGDLHLTQPGLPNYVAAVQMTEEVNNWIKPDFVQFIGDNVQDATESQWRLFDELRSRLDAPHFALTGDHDIKDDPAANGFRARFESTYGAFSIRGFRFLRLDSQQYRPVGFHRDQLEWLRLQIRDAAIAGERVVLFQHNYPYQIWEDFDGPGIDEWRAIAATSPIAAVFCGHTHYFQVANDGRNVVAAVRSIGDPEGGLPGYLIGHVRGDDLAFVYRDLASDPRDDDPIVLTTHPCDVPLATSPRHIVSGPDRIEARVWSRATIAESRAAVYDDIVRPLAPVGDGYFTAVLDPSGLEKGAHRLKVHIVDVEGRVGRCETEFVFDPTRRFTAVPQTRPIVTSTHFC
ncbi:MAG: metallophosphoesterase [Planctomycetota bacterium]|nr:metallophosphoesterase [Planctomycetota bacterium]